MRYAVDSILGDVARCQNLDTLEMIDIPLNVLPEDISDGVCLIYQNGSYNICDELYKDRVLTIREKLEKLKHLD